MSKPPTNGTRASDENGKEPVSDSVYLIVSMADTTWRMFVPTIGLLLAGHYLDTLWHTKPWMMLVGVTIGGAIAGLLIKRQLAKGRK